MFWWKKCWLTIRTEEGGEKKIILIFKKYTFYVTFPFFVYNKLSKNSKLLQTKWQDLKKIFPKFPVVPRIKLGKSKPHF